MILNDAANAVEAARRDARGPEARRAELRHGRLTRKLTALGMLGRSGGVSL
ncbi:hypothetical protein [Methylobacterium nigriterrae]|uniref:hypothetical protein n=1 Tax=Methylobacterium nigriterrae TaxID=3127512 RepID=UPI0030138074